MANYENELQNKLASCLEYPEKVLFLDIETTGLSRYDDDITIVGWSLNGESHTYVNGTRPSLSSKMFSGAKAVVTFNGMNFDEPFLEEKFPKVRLPSTHFDLMHLGRIVGLTGGQKAIEEELGIDLRLEVPGVEDVDGREAVRLWHRYQDGDESALEKLILYNQVDIAAMGAMLDCMLPALLPDTDVEEYDPCFHVWAGPEFWEFVD